LPSKFKQPQTHILLNFEQTAENSLPKLWGKVWGLADWFCLQGVWAVRMNCCSRLGFGGATVHLGKVLGYQLSCYTTEGVIKLSIAS
jgi:hypothetical protein